MPWCPECGVEYREGFSRCSECDRKLQPGSPPEPEGTVEPGPEWVVIGVYSTSEEAELIQGFLVEGGIRATIVDRTMHAQPFGMNLLGEVLLYVEPGNEERARAMLTEAAAGAAELPPDVAVEDGGPNRNTA